MKMTSFRIEKALWDEFKRRYEKIGLSAKLRELIIKELNGHPIEAMVKKQDWKALKEIIFKDEKPIQIVGEVGVGKSLSMKELIKNDSNHVYIVFDCHNEYDFLPEIQSISHEIKHSSRIVLPKQVSASIGLFPVYANQILSQKWPNNFVFVVEEAHRYPQTKLLLKESRKFVKIVVITQEPIASFCPIVKILE